MYPSLAPYIVRPGHGNAGRPHRELKALAQMRANNIRRDIENEWTRQDRAVAILAAKYGKKLSWMQTRLQRLPRYMKSQRAINKWNALVHAQSMDINEGKISLSII